MTTIYAQCTPVFKLCRSTNHNQVWLCHSRQVSPPRKDPQLKLPGKGYYAVTDYRPSPHNIRKTTAVVVS